MEYLTDLKHKNVYSQVQNDELYADDLSYPNSKLNQFNKDDDLHDSEKIVAFNFDGCLADTSVQRTGPDAWSLMYPSIPERLQGLHDDGYKLVIFTDESNIERWKFKRQQAVDSKIGRLNNFINTVKVPIQVFVACGLGKSKDHTDDPFRKPKPGMWRLMKKHFNSGVAINMEQCIVIPEYGVVTRSLKPLVKMLLILVINKALSCSSRGTRKFDYLHI